MKYAPLLALAGCADVWGFDRPPPTMLDVDGHLARHIVTNNPDLTPRSDDVPYDAPPRVYEGGDEVPIEWTAETGRFTFRVPEGDPYRIVVDLNEYQLTAPAPEIAISLPGRLDAAPVLDTTLVHITTNASVIGNVQLLTSGVYSATATVSATGLEHNVMWPTAGFAGVRGMLDARKNDAAWLVEYVNLPAGHSAIDRVIPLRPTLTAGKNDIAGTWRGQQETGCVHVSAPFRTEKQRLVAAYPALTTVTANWTLFSVPKPAFGISAFSTLASHSGNPASLADVEIDAHFGSPFLGNETLMTVSYSMRKSTSDPAEIAVSYQDLVSPGTMCPRHSNPGGIALPAKPKLAGVPLVDNVVVGLTPGLEPMLTWDELPAEITPVGYVVQVRDITGGADKRLRNIFTPVRSAILDPTMFEIDHSYTVSIFGQTHYPNMIDGDTATRAFPFASGGLISRPFHVSR